MFALRRSQKKSQVGHVIFLALRTLRPRNTTNQRVTKQRMHPSALRPSDSYQTGNEVMGRGMTGTDGMIAWVQGLPYSTLEKR